MAQTFLTATGSTALAIELLRQFNYAVPQPRSWSSTGLFNSAIDGNILGGLLLGAGMALSSSCPGMALPQLALGLPSAPAAVAGACTGGVVWSALLRPWLTQRRGIRSRHARPPSSMSLPQMLGLSRTMTVLLFEMVLVLAVYVVATRMSTAWSPIRPVVGGLLIGGAQVGSLLLRGSLVGVSTCFEQLGEWVVYMAKGGRRGARPGTSAMLFAAAMVGGAWALAARRPDLTPRIAYSGPSTGTAFTGGILMAVGSRLAGGCTCGHGISGLALLSMSSLVTMIATFVAAIGVLKYMA
ncbi:hypothetical protein N0V93_007167 [Gnomoniopsis smithogilvyi]|uniref:Sulphur transport domain-containing protein n=1 Tax=Gnomoniopsis smithogilvyi TaxID=1191159 RepID=A0A9W8YQ07_9PEZI|nr:hypothetical protein N0V93_007167 [Gnomoniopsis smithogilvyi]